MTHPLLKHYQVAAGRYDEMFDAGQAARPQWRALLARLEAETPAQMRARLDAVQRQVRENGVTYNVYADTKGEQRPWDLNVLPLILPPEEWAHIEAAVIQRAGLLNHILCDVYGDQKLIADGLLPPALIHGNAGFLRACHGAPQTDGIALHMYAVDLARAPDGRWWVVTDRTQAPSGAGYALENRNIISRAFPELFRDLKVQHLNNFFLTLRDSLTHWGRQVAGQQDGDTPLVVLLTPGPHNETYYEQSYLARYLGFPLVEGKDLTVRNGMVWLKTLSGPQRVHVVLRRVDDDFCDPLELRANSALGVVGLADAARRGNVLVANGLGSNLLESGALLGYLPKIARGLRGEELKMPSVATWWCGEPAALENVLSRLSSLIIKPAYPQARVAPVFGADLTPGARFNLIREMRARPQNYVAQEMVNLSHAPVWQDGGLQSSAAGLRVYACATPNGYMVMPGGLTRVATGRDTRVINMQRGGAAKDTWVQSRDVVSHPAPLLHTITGADLVRGDATIGSRLVENLFWFGRYSARCDNIARLTRSALDFILNISPEYRGGEWLAVQSLCAWYGLFPGVEAGAANQGLLRSDAEIEFALLQAVVAKDSPGLASSLQQLYTVAGHLRERLSVDNWRTLNQLIKQTDEAVRHPTLADAATLLDDATRTLMTLSGFALDGMTRDDGWRFLSIGRRLERLQFMCTVLQQALKMPPASGLDWLLEIADSIVTYRSRYMSQPEWLPALDLLVSDTSNPRSIAFQLEGLVKYFDHLTERYGPCGAEAFTPLLAELRALDPDHDLVAASPALQSLLKKILAAGTVLSDQIGMRFFTFSS